MTYPVMPDIPHRGHFLTVIRTSGRQEKVLRQEQPLNHSASTSVSRVGTAYLQLPLLNLSDPALPHTLFHWADLIWQTGKGPRRGMHVENRSWRRVFRVDLAYLQLPRVLEVRLGSPCQGPAALHAICGQEAVQQKLPGCPRTKGVLLLIRHILLCILRPRALLHGRHLHVACAVKASIWILNRLPCDLCILLSMFSAGWTYPMTCACSVKMHRTG